MVEELTVSAIRVAADRKSVELDFERGDSLETHSLVAEYLRVESPSAEVQGHGPDQKKLVSGKADVTIEQIDPVGHYAIRITFSDGHATGLYTWETLHDLAEDHAILWPAYLRALSAAGKSR
tara:strand:+ start:161 stop:526 length:366 start_codon:yes stop_codon:yes gene_type:complete